MAEQLPALFLVNLVYAIDYDENGAGQRKSLFQQVFGRPGAMLQLSLVGLDENVLYFGVGEGKLK